MTTRQIGCIENTDCSTKSKSEAKTQVTICTEDKLCDATQNLIDILSEDIRRPGRLVERSGELTESSTDEDQSSKEFSKNDFYCLFHPETFFKFFLKIQIKI